MKKITLGTALLSIGLTTAPAMGKVLLTEELLREESKKSNPQLEQIESALLASKVSRAQTMEQFEYQVEASASYAQTKERPVISFQVVNTPTKVFDVTLSKKFQSGLQTSAEVYTYQQSSNASGFVNEIDNATTTRVSFTAQMDIWKDLMGSLTKKQVQNVTLAEEQSNLQKDINQTTFFYSLRKLYWNLVANNESIKIYKNLLKTAKRQTAEAEERLKSRVSERDEVLRYKAQEASRRSSLEYYKYQKQNIIKQLRQLIPAFNAQDIELGAYNLDDAVDNVLQCTAKITSYSKVPYENTKYDELVSLIRKIQGNYKSINDQYTDPNVNLYGTVKSTGVSADAGTNITDGSYGGSWSDQVDNNRTGFEVGVNVSFTLGSAEKTTQEYLLEYDRKRLEATLKDTDTKMVSTHEELSHSIGYLASVIKAEKINAANLAERIKYMQRKYEQARATVTELINDQDSYMNAQLSTINAQLEIVNIVLDYLTIYSDTPCGFNLKV